MAQERGYVASPDARYDVWLFDGNGASQVGAGLMLTLAYTVASVWTEDPAVCVSVTDAQTGQIIARR